MSGLRGMAWAVVVVGLSACGMDAAEDAQDLGVADVDGVEQELSTTTYYWALRHDDRRCAFPMCGGYWVSRPGQALSTCVDETRAAECYVAELDLSHVTMTEEQRQTVRDGLGPAASARVLLRGRIEARSYYNGTFGAFRTTEAWRAPAAGTATGTFYKLTPSGIRCITFPCPDLREDKLNSSTRRNIHGLDLADAPGTGAQHNTAVEAAYSTVGLLAAGRNVVVPNAGPAGDATALDVTQYFVRFAPGRSAGQTCSATASCGGGLVCCASGGARPVDGMTSTHVCMVPDADGACLARP